MESEQLEVLILSLLILFMLGAFKASADELNAEFKEGQ